jgi:hypothetical protein
VLSSINRLGQAGSQKSKLSRAFKKRHNGTNFFLHIAGTSEKNEEKIRCEGSRSRRIVLLRILSISSSSRREGTGYHIMTLTDTLNNAVAGSFVGRFFQIKVR